ncbi:MAG: PD-(D/E)XK nuclease family protein [Proteobacteria bacterium]|nr:PD-(D/E)XK nuclease family protein [Pseudomonadota bacterium]
MTKAFAWSYSALKNFETCPKRHWHISIAKDVVEPESSALREGNELHKAFDARLREKKPLPMTMAVHESMLATIEAAPGETYSEAKMAITREFQPATFFARNVWMRTVVDCTKVNGEEARVFDWKTGKPKDDSTQLAIMAAAIFANQPQVQRIKAALVFVGYTEVIAEGFTREGMSEVWAELIPRVAALESALKSTSFPARPSGLCRRYCPVRVCPHHGT